MREWKDLVGLSLGQSLNLGNLFGFWEGLWLWNRWVSPWWADTGPGCCRRRQQLPLFWGNVTPWGGESRICHARPRALQTSLLVVIAAPLRGAMLAGALGQVVLLLVHPQPGH